MIKTLPRPNKRELNAILGRSPSLINPLAPIVLKKQKKQSLEKAPGDMRTRFAEQNRARDPAQDVPFSLYPRVISEGFAKNSAQPNYERDPRILYGKKQWDITTLLIICPTDTLSPQIEGERVRERGYVT